jgi:hypothetical protein
VFGFFLRLFLLVRVGVVLFRVVRVGRFQVVWLLLRLV